MKQVITLERRGFDFWQKDDIAKHSDIGNHRVGIYEYSVKGKDGKTYLIEFTHGPHKNYRKTHKITGKPLKHYVEELITPYGLYIDTAYEREETSGSGYTYTACYRNRTLESELWNMHLEFTKEGIAAALNYITGTADYTADNIIID